MACMNIMSKSPAEENGDNSSRNDDELSEIMSLISETLEESDEPVNTEEIQALLKDLGASNKEREEYEIQSLLESLPELDDAPLHPGVHDQDDAGATDELLAAIVNGAESKSSDGPENLASDSGAGLSHRREEVQEGAGQSTRRKARRIHPIDGEPSYIEAAFIPAPRESVEDTPPSKSPVVSEKPSPRHVRSVSTRPRKPRGSDGPVTLKELFGPGSEIDQVEPEAALAPQSRSLEQEPLESLPHDEDIAIPPLRDPLASRRMMAAKRIEGFILDDVRTPLNFRILRFLMVSGVDRVSVEDLHEELVEASDRVRGGLETLTASGLLLRERTRYSINPRARKLVLLGTAIAQWQGSRQRDVIWALLNQSRISAEDLEATEGTASEPAPA